MGMKILTLIPAKGLSRGVPRKNIRMCAGKPLLVWTIEAALKAGLFPWVSTEDSEIIGVAAVAGAGVMGRHSEHATDTSHVLQWVTAGALGKKLRANDWLLLLQPTNPLRTAEDIKRAIAIAEAEHGIDSVVTVHEIAAHHPGLVKQIKGTRLFPFDNSPRTGKWEDRRQDLRPKAYVRDGAIYMTRREIIEDGSMTGSIIRPLILPEESSVNIDTELDLRLASMLLQERNDRNS